MSFLIASTTISVFGQLQAGQAARAQGAMQGQQLDYQAKVERDNALQTASLIRRQGRYAVGAADVAAAASGVVVGQGSAGEAERQIYQDSEQDAYQAILSGDRRARGLSVQAVGARASGDIANANAQMAAAGTVLSSGYKMFSGWRTQTQAPAPVETRTPTENPFYATRRGM